jgi:hypothetical protein
MYIYIENHCSQMLLKTIKYPWKAVGFLGGSLREIWRFFEVFETSGTGGSLNSICCFSQRLPGLNNGCLRLWEYSSTWEPEGIRKLYCIYCRLYHYSIVSRTREHVRIVNSAVMVTGDRIHRSPLCEERERERDPERLYSSCLRARSISLDAKELLHRAAIITGFFLSCWHAVNKN